MEAHPIADIFPPMANGEYQAFVADLRANGQREPIWTYKGQILDGRNRFRACTELGIRPLTTEYQGDEASLTAFVISLNLHRRHLNASQRALVAAKLANMPLGGAVYRSATLRTETPMVSQTDAAKMLNVSERSIQTAKAIEQAAPQLLPKIAAGTMTLGAAEKEVRAQARKEERVTMAAASAALQPTDRWQVEVADIRTYNPGRQFDFIITDPPYPREYLPLYEVLAERAREWLKPGGLLIAMCGQSYLDQVYASMSKHLTYYWTSCYLMPGQPTGLRHKQVNTSWKPLLVYSVDGNYKGKTFGDVYTSPGPEKGGHEWQQSVDGMLAIMRQVCLPGQSIFDPFLGAGTTGVAALKHGCTFHGIDVDGLSVNLSKGRLAEVYD
jgi:16S rRNA G966 N2-methylase RsmD